MRVTFVTAIAVDWAAIMVAHAVVRNTAISNRACGGAIPSRTAAMGFTALLTTSSERTFLSIAINVRGTRLGRDRAADANTLTRTTCQLNFSA